MAALSDILETTGLQKVATGFVFTEGPLWHPDGFFYFVDVRASVLYRLALGDKPQVVRETQGGNGLTFDLQGRLINCEGDGRRVTRTGPDGTVTTLIDRVEGKRVNRPNDVICASDGALLFTDPSLRVPLAEREQEYAAVYRIAPGGAVTMVAPFEYPNGLALSPDERTLYVANTRWTKYIHAIELDAAGAMVRRRIFADMSSDGTNGVPDGMKVDAAGRVFCTWHRRRVGIRAGWLEDRHHRDARGMRQCRVRRPRSAHAAADREHVGLYAAGEDAGAAASVVQSAGRMMKGPLPRTTASTADDSLNVMPTKAGIHDFPFGGSQSRGWRAFARHDANGRIDKSSVWRAGIIVPPRQVVPARRRDPQRAVDCCLDRVL